MNIYVETNFILELTFEQEQNKACEKILELSQTNQINLILPAYSLAEPHEKLTRQANSRRELQRLLNNELGQLSRSLSYTDRIKSIKDIAKLIIQSNQEEWQRFNQYRDRLIDCAEFIPLNIHILQAAISFETLYSLKSQDAIVFASVISHLHHNKPDQACFLNKNSKDFDSPDIVLELNNWNCRMIPRFDHGFNFIQSQL